MGRLRTVAKDGTLIAEYRYDPEGTGTRTYEKNALRGITGRNFSYSDEDHLLTAGAATYQYDTDGFILSKTFGTEVTQYEYSTRGELLSVSLPDGRTIEYLYDPLSRRTARLVNGTVVEKYLWQGLTKLIAVYDSSDSLLMRFEYADGRMPVAMSKNASTYYLNFNQVGTLKAIADSTGNVVKSIEYDSFGNIINDSNPAFEVPFAFAGGLHDRDTGLIRFGYRGYDPDIGRWTAKDPILFEGGDTDLYGYCLNDPVNALDPVGFGPLGATTDLTIAAAIEAAKLSRIIALPLTIITAPIGDLIDPASTSDYGDRMMDAILEAEAENGRMKKQFDEVKASLKDIHEILKNKKRLRDNACAR